MTVAAALRRACGVAALLGLFAMHGLAVHGAAHAGHQADPIPAAVTVADHDHAAGDTSDTGALQERGGDPDLAGFAGLCLAVLLAGIAAAVLLSLGIRLPRRADSADSLGRPTRSRRHRDPPCLFALSIQRC